MALTACGGEMDFLGCNSSLRMFQIDRNTLKLSSATPMVNGNVIYPIEDKYVEPYFGYQCDITTDFDKIDLLVKQTIEKNSAYYFDLYGIPSTEEKRKKAKDEKLKKRKI